MSYYRDVSSVVQTHDKFEVWDGGHCYIRASREKTSHGEEFIKLSRFPTRTSAKNVALLGIWAGQAPDDTDYSGCPSSLNPDNPR